MKTVADRVGAPAFPPVRLEPSAPRPEAIVVQRRALLSAVGMLVALALAVAGFASLPPSAGAASPFDQDEVQKAVEDRPATDSPRLRRAADALRSDPLYVDPELSWVLTAAEQRSLRRALGKARVPVVVAVLPSIDEDESGGDSERTLQALQRLLRRDAVYVTADQRGWFDLASMGIPLDLSVPYSLTMPRRNLRTLGDEEREPDAPGHASLAERLEKMLDYVAVAEPGTPNGPIADDDVRPLDELSSASGYDATEDVIAASVMGVFLGLVAAGIVLGIRKLVISPVPDPAGRGSSGGPRRRQPGGRSGGRSGKRRGKGGKRRGRRGA